MNGENGIGVNGANYVVSVAGVGFTVGVNEDGVNVVQANGVKVGSSCAIAVRKALILLPLIVLILLMLMLLLLILV